MAVARSSGLLQAASAWSFKQWPSTNNKSLFSSISAGSMLSGGSRGSSNGKEGPEGHNQPDHDAMPRPQPRWQWLGVGSLTAVLLWLAGSSLLSWYLSNFGNYSATYGSLGAAIGLMMWMWMSAITVLYGAELNSEIEHQTAVDTTTGPARPMGTRG
eukprot:gene8161-11050_t